MDHLDFITQALQELFHNSWETCSGIDDIVWKDGHTTTATETSQISARVAELQAAYDATEYQRTRAGAYPSIQEQLDMQYWDSVNGTTTWADAIAAVKAQYPKPE